MSSQLRIVPGGSQSTTVRNTEYGPAAPSAPGLVDTLRSNEGPLSVSSKINNRHPLESRIKNWDQTQRDHQLETYRRMFGAAEPIKREMELNIVQENDFKPMLLGGPSNTQRDILLNRDTSLDWEDIYTGFDGQPSFGDFHSEMEKKMGI